MKEVVIVTYRRRKHDLNKFSISLYNLLYTKDKTQKELAAHMNVCVSLVSQWICGVRIPRLDQAAKIAEFFDVTLNELWKGDTAE